MCNRETYILSEAEILIESDTNVQCNEIPLLNVLEENDLILGNELAEDPTYEDNNRISTYEAAQKYNETKADEAVFRETNSFNDPDWAATNSDKDNSD